MRAAATLLLLVSPVAGFVVDVVPRRSLNVAARRVRMADDDQKSIELAKDIPFANYSPSEMDFKGAESPNAPLGGAPGQSLSGIAKFMPYAGGLAVLGLLTGGLTEDAVYELFAPVREAGGYGGLLKVEDTPDMQKARALKAKQKAKRQELINSKKDVDAVAPGEATLE